MDIQSKDGRCMPKKGKMNKNNKKLNVEETAIDENRHSELKDMAGDVTEVTQLLSAAVQK